LSGPDRKAREEMVLNPRWPAQKEFVSERMRSGRETRRVSTAPPGGKMAGPLRPGKKVDIMVWEAVHRDHLCV